MKLYWQIIKLLFCKFILRYSNGKVLKNFAEAMGVVYIKLAQILATQNYGEAFSETDRQTLSTLCDQCLPLPFSEIERLLKQAYGEAYAQIFTSIDEVPLGAASVSQVHKAQLVSGETVAIKILRPGITKTIDRELARIRKLMYRFGKLIKFKNYAGGDHALELYLSWIKQETDFQHECQNLQNYQKFVKRANYSVPGTSQIHVPKVYPDLCRDNVIVMEFVAVKTVNQLALTTHNKAKINHAINSYLKLSFEAMLLGRSMSFHGDPHPGNLCIDDAGDIWFLDLGMLCVLDAAETKWCRDFFLAIYTHNDTKVSDLLLQYGHLEGVEKLVFCEECRAYCHDVRNKNITSYFVDMMGICLRHELVPPDFLFSLVKAFLCLNGICKFTDNPLSAPELLQAQAVKYILRRTAEDCRNLLRDGLNTLPQTLFTAPFTMFGQNPPDFFAATQNRDFKHDLQASFDHLHEALALARVSFCNQE